MQNRLIRLVRGSILFVVMFWGVPLQGQLPRTRLNTIFPPGGQAGTTVPVTINGDLTAAATELLFSHPGIEATQQIEPPTDYRVAHRKQRQFDVRIGEDVPNGRYEARALGPAGLSNPRSFVVTRLPERRFDAGKNAREEPFRLEVGEVANGATRADKRDYYVFSATAGEPLLIQVRAGNIDSRLDAALAVYHRESGKRVGRVNQGMTTDPSMTLLPARDGEYLIEVWDRTYRGGEDYAYRLEVSQRAQVEAIFPPVAEDGREQAFTLYGYNLPGGAPISGPTGSGQLQSLPVAFTPRFEQAQAFSTGLAAGAPAGARLDAGSFALPAPFRGAENVFLARAKHSVVREQDGNDSPEQPQRLTLPVEVGGQFFPRRDVDWYAVELKKNQVVWVELASHQLGTNTDPTLRVAKWAKSGEQQTLKTVSTADDLEGPPSGRDARRLNTTSGDAALRFRADADGTYLISVRDQYNAAADDPRLVYRLRVTPEKPDFQLIALAEPERHNDDKIAKPNGLSLFPGGSTLVRVRLLPAHNFSEPVRVVARGLPPGVTSQPLVLSSRHREGYLVLQASMDVADAVEPIQIVGTSKAQERIARTATARRTANNLDSEQTYSRLSQDLLLAVVSAAPPAARLTLPQATLATSPGAKLTLPVKLQRKEGFAAELELLGLQVPKGIKVDKVKTKDDHAELLVHVEDGKLPPGRYTFPVAAKVKEKRPKNTVVVREAEGDLEKIRALVTVQSQRVTDQQDAVKQAQAARVAMAEVQAKAKQAAQGPQEKLSALLKEQRTVVGLLAEKLEASAGTLISPAVLDEIDRLELRLADLKKNRLAIQQQYAATAEALSVAEQSLQQAAAQATDAEAQLKQLQAAQAEVEKQRAAAEKRLADVRKAELEQDAEYFIYSPAVQLSVEKSPLAVKVAEHHTLSGGDTLRVPLLVRRRFGFSGPVVVNVHVPGGAPFSAGSLVLGEGQRVAHLVLSADAEVKPGSYDVSLKFQLKFNDLELTDTATLAVRVEK